MNLEQSGRLLIIKKPLLQIQQESSGDGVKYLGVCTNCSFSSGFEVIFSPRVSQGGERVSKEDWGRVWLSPGGGMNGGVALLHFHAVAFFLFVFGVLTYPGPTSSRFCKAARHAKLTACVFQRAFAVNLNFSWPTGAHEISDPPGWSLLAAWFWSPSRMQTVSSGLT